jgi:hypothetical protein
MNSFKFQTLSALRSIIRMRDTLNVVISAQGREESQLEGSQEANRSGAKQESGGVIAYTGRIYAKACRSRLSSGAEPSREGKRFTLFIVIDFNKCEYVSSTII